MKSQTTADLPTLRNLLDAGAHFGHRRERMVPTAAPYVFQIRDGVAVINLEETQTKLAEAARLLEDGASQGKAILFVGTKRQAQDAVLEAAKQTTMPYVVTRWLGGTLTNFDVIRRNIQRMFELDKILAHDEEKAKYTKRERLKMEEQTRKLHANLDGIAEMTRLPDLVVIVDPLEEETALAEARRLGIPVVAICDTDVNPELVDYPIPANDDAPKAIGVILSYLAAAVNRGRSKAK